MDFALLIFAFLIVALGTILFFKLFGVPGDSIFYSRAQKVDFQNAISPFSSKIFIANVVGSLTSLATVYVFFIGTSKVFGWVIISAPVSLFLGYALTNYFTRRVLSRCARFRKQVTDDEQTSGVIANIFWGDSREERSVALVAKHVSLVSIAAFIWLEISVFSTITTELLHANPRTFGVTSFFITALVITYIVLKYGVRGFVFSDLFQTPVIFFGSLLILLGVLIAIYLRSSAVPEVGGGGLLVQILTPLATPIVLILFTLHVALSNLSFVVLSELHWLRVWLFRPEEAIRLQRISIVTTSFVWLILAIIGLCGNLFGTSVGVDGILDLLNDGVLRNPVFHLAFWLVACAALFSTADAQVYAFLVVFAYDVKRGEINRSSTRPMRPLLMALIVSAPATLAFFLLQISALPFEKLIFILAPILLNLLPALADAAIVGKIRLWPVALSLALYTVFSVVGLLQPNDQLAFTLAAALVPTVLTVINVVLSKPAQTLSAS